MYLNNKLFFLWVGIEYVLEGLFTCSYLPESIELDPLNK